MTTILLVEDNKLNREMFSRRLERQGFRVLTAGDGQEAVQVATEERPALVLMDLSLPIMDGWEATRRLKADPRTANIPVIALTAHAMVGDRERAMQAGCNEYETKPVEMPRLMAKLQKLIGEVAPSAPAPTAAVTPTPRRSPAMEPMPARTPTPSSAPPSTGSRVLVVDDNELNREMLVRRLEREGYQISIAEDGRQAIGAVATDDIDLVLLDVMMPQLNGLDVLRTIRNSHSMSELPVIILTAKDQQEDMVAALELGANDYVTKPFNLTVLIARIKNHLAQKRGNSASIGVERAVRPAGRTGSGSSDWASMARKGPGSSHVESPSTWRGGSGSSSNAGSSAHTGTWTQADTLHWGEVIAGYEILQELGRGAMGIVYKARHVHMNRIVALKVISREDLGRGHTVQRFLREVQVAASLSHRNIVLAFDAGVADHAQYFAMEYVEGEDLQRFIAERGPLPVSVACNYVAQTARGLQHASQRGLVHRDIKPSNLFATWEEDEDQIHRPPERATIKILDFGLALLYEAGDGVAGAAGLTRDGRVVGTADYMAPEQWTNAHKVDVRADLYALGGVFYFLLTGRVPYPEGEPMEKMLKHHMEQPAPVTQFRSDIDLEVQTILKKLMAKKADQRFQQPADVVAALSSLSAVAV